MLKKIIVKQNSTINKAIQILDKFYDLKIVLVVDNDSKLIGTITDGDVRRGLLKGFGTNDKVEKIMFKNFRFLTEEKITDKEIQKLKKMDVKQIPILNKKKNILKVLKLDEINSETKKDIVIFMMAGGFGKRLKPITDKIPKPLVTIDSKPIIKILIENFLSCGFFNFYISVFFKSQDIKKYLGNGSKGHSIKYIEEKNPLGTAGSLSKIKNISFKGPIIVINADIITSIDFNELLNYHKKNNADITVCVRQYTMNIPFGVLESKNKRVSSINEKPSKHFWVNAGIYVFEKEIIKKIQSNKKIDMPDLINSLAKNKKVVPFPIFENWHDIGQMKELIEVRKLYSKKD